MQEPLDPKQLKRIEAVHGGFLYQHLYTVGCILLANEANIKSIHPERDEDIELVFEDRHVYIQVKKRSEQFQCSDIEMTLMRFNEIRNAHISGKRPSAYELWIICSTTPGPSLEKTIESGLYPSDINFLFKNSQQRPGYLPPAWNGNEEALEWCSRIAETIPFCRLDGHTLTWKLAGLVQYAATGTSQRPYHSFNTDELPHLFEQVVVQLQQFPSSSGIYYPLDNEPRFLSSSRVRLIAGLSGAGKTAWASESAVYCNSNAVYFSVGDTPNSALASTLSRELAGYFSKKHEFNLGNILIPGITGLNSVRALDIELSRREIPVVVVVDNAHRVTPVVLSDIINATRHISWVLLAQPTPEQKELTELLKIDEEVLSGWSIETITEAFACEGCLTDYHTAERVLRLTGGLPLYVLNSVKLCKKYYDSSSLLLCDNLENMQHPAKTSQERILIRITNGLSQIVTQTMALLSISDAPLSAEEISEIAFMSLCINKQDTIHSLREMKEWGIIQYFHDRTLILHDAFRIISKDYLSSLGSKEINNLYRAYVDILKVSVLKEPNIGKQRLYLRLLPLAGQIKTLIDLASNDAEMFGELGYATDAKNAILSAIKTGELDNQETYWGLDTLAFWACQSHDWAEVEKYIKGMEERIALFSAGRREKTTLSIKHVLLSKGKRDLDSARKHYIEACKLNIEHPETLRILRYDYALCLYSLEKYAEAELETDSLVKEYYDVLGLVPEDVVFKNPPEILEKIDKTQSYQDDLKHLADSLDLYSNCRNKRGLDSVLARIHAYKFYVMASAWISAVRLGQDFVDERLSWSDTKGARSFLESTLMPLVKELKLFDHIIPVRSQYAVVLAYCGEKERALSEIQLLKRILINNPEFRKEFENQCLLVDKINNGEVVLPRRNKVLPKYESGRFPQRKIGRNEKCPCGSGKKYKQCCGMAGSNYLI